jgi:multidrug transporter EmrE-like cation transporter
MKYWLALFVALSLNAAANLMMKIGMQTVQSSGGLLKTGVIGAVRTVLTSPVLVIGLCCFALNAAFFMFALQSKALKISIAYPIMVCGCFALIAIGARFHPSLAERLTGGQWIGVMWVLLGILMIAADHGSVEPATT